MTASFCFPKASHFNPATYDALPTIWVDNDRTLYQLIDDIDDVDTVAVDTEFIRRTTYMPILALVQVNTGRAVYLVDAPKLDLTEFWQALSEVPMMIWYACGEDLTIFYTLSDTLPLSNVFDVQIAIGYLTGKLQIGYAHTIKEVLGLELDKDESQSNWLNRPLSDKQKEYAINDVRYLLALYDVIKDALTSAGTYELVCQDSNCYAQEIYANLHIPDDELYLDFTTPEYTSMQLAVLKSLVSWREKTARQNNEPRSFIIGKQALREIVEILPTTTKALASTTINRKAIRIYGEQILKLIKTAQSLPKEQHPTPKPAYTSKKKPFKNALNQAIEIYANQLGVPQDLLLKNRHINHLLLMVHQNMPFEAQYLPKELQGYRQIWVINTVLPLLATFKAQIDAGFMAMTTH